MMGRTARVDDADLVDGATDHPLIDEKRRFVLAGVELLPRSIGQATLPVIGRLELNPGETKELIVAAWENALGAVQPDNLPDFLSWATQAKSGSVRLKARSAGEFGFDIPNAPGGFSETEGLSVAGWYVEEITGEASAVVQILATVKKS